MKTKHPWLVEIGSRVKTARENKGLSQEALASLAGLDRTYIGGIERGERNVAAINIIKISIALNIPVTALFPDTSELRRK